MVFVPMHPEEFSTGATLAERREQLVIRAHLHSPVGY